MPNLDSVPPPTPDPGAPVGEPRLESAWNAQLPLDPNRDLLGRHRALQLISIALIVAGLVLPIAAVLAYRDLLPALTSGDVGQSLVQRLLVPLLLVLLGGLALLGGLVLNTVRALVVRAALPLERYRGPSVIVLLLIALIVGSLAGLPAGKDALAIQFGGALTVGGTLLILTATQIGLLAVTGGLVVVPRTLAGLHLSPSKGLLRSMLIGLLLAIPAWIGTTLLANLVVGLLRSLGLSPTAGPVDAVLTRGDPTVLVLAVVLVAPIAEELFFRGLVFNAWERERGTRVAVVGSAALFALIHGSLVQLLPIFVLGIGLALLYRSTRSLPATMAMHAGFNAITVTITLLARLGVISLPT